MSAERACEAAGVAKALPSERPPNFDRLAPVYRWMEWLSFGPYLWRARCAFLREMAGARHALVLGDGDGRFTAALLRYNAQVRVDAVDLSPAMLKSLRRRAGAEASRVRTEAADLRRWTPAPDEPYDLVVTHFFLDCLATEEVKALARRVRPCLTADAVWVISEFEVPAGPFGRFIARPVVGLLYWAFGLLTGMAVRRLPEYGRGMESAGFGLVRRESLLNGLLRSEIRRVDRGG